MQGMQFAIIAKFLPCGSSASEEAFQLLNNFIISAPPPPPFPLIFIQFLSDLLLSHPKAECPLLCPAFLPCTAVARLSNPLLVPPLPCLSASVRPRRRQHPCTPLSPSVSLSGPATPTVRPCYALSPNPALPPADASIPTVRLSFHHGSYPRSPSLQA